MQCFARNIYFEMSLYLLILKEKYSQEDTEFILGKPL
jgi:hypothetical protein